MRLLVITVTIILLQSAVYAKEALFPNGCRSVGYSFKHYTLILKPNLKGHSQSLYFIHNKTSQPLTFYQMRTGNEAYIMHLNNKIQPWQWGVFATDEKQVRFICATPSTTSDYGQIVNCENVVELCEYPNVKFSINNHGNYWAVPSDEKIKARNNVIKQGVLLKW